MKINNILREELSIANDVIKISNDVFSNVIKIIKDNIQENIFDKLYNFNFSYADKFNVTLNTVNFRTKEDYLFFGYDENNITIMTNAYYANDNTLYLFFGLINNKIDYNDILNTIQHEIEHYYQGVCKQSSLSTSDYQWAISNLNNENIFIAILSQIKYFTKQFELDAQINGAYSEGKSFNFNMLSYSDFIKHTQLINLFDRLRELKQIINKWNWNSSIVKSSIDICTPYFRWHKGYNELSFLNKAIDWSINYLQKKSLKIYARLKIEKSNNNVDEEKFKNNILYRKMIIKSLNENKWQQHGRK